MGAINKAQFIENFQYFDKEIVLEIIDIFLKEYPERIKTIAADIEAGDCDNLKFNAHSIKGVIANFVAPDAEQCARELEIMATEKNMDGVKELFVEFKESSESMVDELKELRENFT
ncbi:MAG TPA: Hpt domain-containing protein [Bacteroidales bacterium]|jgi:HPt (histidine-containing phosphotransfer) domain-containing protein|nr:hypothetical protein [Bacteroidota bacterium]HJN06862.1 Hpt domain-containing protein [Bacteroidales bacterium]|tara:strand:- start:745 stop:1092 length:348 start_codon:yes stop_codon:yes gene_type:complete